MIDLTTLKKMKDVDINTIDPETIVDASQIEIDINQPVHERIADFVKQTGNPYFIKVGKVIVKMGYSDTSTNVNDCFERYMKIC